MKPSALRLYPNPWVLSLTDFATEKAMCQGTNLTRHLDEAMPSSKTVAVSS
ncbi:hypothetical protein [Sphingorhabdus sp.]|jgi:hypothetical protein|uniref:hypothetical protein n=1 Tax=Sphingorhabdus sp. TaxID=1902408 RepID=UPI0037CB280E